MIWLKYFLIFTVVLGIIIGISLMYRIRTAKSNVNILFSLMVLSLSVFIALETQSIFLISLPKLHLLSSVFLLMIPTLFSQFVQELRQIKIQPLQWISFFAVPAVIFLLLIIPYFAMENSLLLETLMLGEAKRLYLGNLFIACCGGVKLFSCIHYVKVNASVKKENHDVETYFLFTMFFSIFLMTFFVQVQHFIGLNTSEFLPAHDLLVYILLILMMTIVFFVIVKPEYFADFKDNPAKANVYSKSKPSREVLNDGKLLLLKLDEYAPYLDPELSLKDLADMLSMKKSEVSLIINKGLGTNYFELINSRRLEAFKKLAASKESRKLSISGMAYDSGFNNRATFYKYFKASMGMTPSEFVRSKQDIDRDVCINQTDKLQNKLP